MVEVKAYPPPLEMTLTRKAHVASPNDPVLSRDYDIVDNAISDGTVVVLLKKITLDDFGNYSFNLKAGEPFHRRNILYFHRTRIFNGHDTEVNIKNKCKP